jgi:uncharacterized protein YkwD
MILSKPVAAAVAATVGAITLSVAPSPAAATDLNSPNGVVAITNAIRARAGCGPVFANRRLNAAARSHSVDMARRGYFGHNTLNGINPGWRVAAAGYSWSAYGENIAWGQPDARSVMNDWMNSPGHRANILDCRFRNIGVGVAYNRSGVPYWTQDFARPR